MRVWDLVEMCAIIWEEDSLGTKFRNVEIRDNLKEKAEKYHERLTELTV